ncbi:MAG: exosortase/archaeosortase family protein [Fimbriimonadaceae bacterium]
MSIAEPTTSAPAPSKLSDTLQTISRSPAFVPGLILFTGIILIFWKMWPQLYDLWTGPDGYYSHGWLVPVISGVIVYKAWPRIQNIPVRAEWIALIPLSITLYLAWLSSANLIYTFMAMALLATISFSTWLIAGWRWMLALAPATLYLAFALPLWTVLINDYTNPLQIYSTKIAYYFLKIFGFGLVYDQVNEPTILYMDNFTLNVAVACSGLKLLLALTAFTTFFILIARLKWWGNLVMIGLILPLAMVINGLRIGLVGIVGEMQNAEAGMTMHDYSGYITLVICFFILFKFARWLGWKN